MLTRKQLDTLDLQDSETPSAKDHTRQPTHPAPLGLGPAAPHQDAEIRHVEEERTAEEHHLADAWASGGLTQDSSDSYDDSLESPRQDVHTRTGTPYADSSSHQYGGDELDTTDTDAEDHPEEELMDDKISSSPSIDDGVYIFPSTWPVRDTSLSTNRPPAVERMARAPDVPIRVESARARLAYAQKNPSSDDHHLRSEYISPSQTPVVASAPVDTKTRWGLLRRTQAASEAVPASDGSSVFPRSGPKAGERGSFAQALLGARQPRASRQTATLPVSAKDDIPGSAQPDYEDDEPNDVFFSSDSRFVDSGWGGECLRDVEDIDFEFVYALHNFVATVDGQANATKGDTMVLLDDSNSYWWLVRVVKDSSIGEF